MPTNLGSWEKRRKFMWCNTVFNMGVIALCLITKQTGDVAKLAVEAGFWSNSATLLFYVFGATTQDILALRSGGSVQHSTVEKTEIKNGVASSELATSSIRAGIAAGDISGVEGARLAGKSQPTGRKKRRAF